jgi:2-dehydropantoate 2-reductase
MRFAILGSGAVGGYYGARLARAGHAVTFIARGAHLAAIRQRGLEVRSHAHGGFVVRAAAEEDTSRAGVADVVLVAVKAYDNSTALPLIRPMLGPDTTILTLQNGVDSASEIAALYGEDRVIGGTTYIATSIAAPGVIEQNGSHHRVIIGEVFGSLPRISERVAAIRRALADSGVDAETAADGRVPVWEKFIILVSAAGFTGAARLPIGPLRSDDRIRAQFLAACAEIERLARAEGVPVAADILQQVSAYIDRIPASMRSSLLIDLSLGKRIEVETLQGSVVRRAERAGVETPIIGTLYAVLKPWASGAAPAG